jgi:multisubunit Na+/H+ antiporter MnhB subunit
MPAPRPRPFFLDVILRSLRFCYLLWGGLLMATLAYYARLRAPDALWRWPDFARLVSGPWGRGLALGLGLSMLLAALIEIWELVDRLLVHFMHEHEREH